MFHYFLILMLSVLTISGKLYGQDSCSILFKIRSDKEVTFEQLLNGFSRGLVAIEEGEFKPTKSEFIDFGKSDSSKKAFEVLDRSSLTSHYKMWALILEKAFPEVASITEKKVRVLEPSFRRYESLFMSRPRFRVLFKELKNRRKARAAQIEIIMQLKMFSRLFSEILGRPINLLKQEDLLTLLEVEKRFELGARGEELDASYEVRARLSADLVPHLKKEAQESPSHVWSELTEYFFQSSSRIPVNQQAFSFYSRNGDKAEVERLMRLLMLPEKVETEAIAALNGFSTFFKEHKRPQHELNFANALLLMKFSEQIFGKLPIVYRSLERNGAISNGAYLQLRILIEQAEYSRVIIEEKMSGYMDRSESLNARVEELLVMSAKLAKRSPELKKEVEEIQESLDRQVVKDFDEDLDRKDIRIFQIEAQLEVLREGAAKKRRREVIEDFYDLNNRWQRLIPEKRYKIEGIDYTGVTFSKDVIDFFQKDPVLGARFLAAFTKSYVNMKQASGLRNFGTLHPQMRDIKIIRGHGKIRIVGKLVDGTIHFFHIHAKDEGYVQKHMQGLVENFEP